MFGGLVLYHDLFPLSVCEYIKSIVVLFCVNLPCTSTRRQCYSEKQKRLGEIWKAKTSFTPGEWNVQSVMLGGLGKDPELSGKMSPPFQSFIEAMSKSLSFIEEVLKSLSFNEAIFCITQK